MNFETKLCRICLKSDSNDDFIDIFYNDSDIATAIYLITSVKIIQQSNRVDLICQNCLEKLNTATEFRANCLEAEEYFQQIEDSLLNQTENDSNIMEIEIIKNTDAKFEGKRTNKSKQKTKYECKKCKKLFSCRYYLQKHEYAVHTEIDPDNYFECDQCNYKSKTKPLMRSHQTNNHSFLSSKSSLEGFQCKFCGRICMSTGALYSHEKIHTNLPIEEYLKCSHCPKSFKEKRLLKNHIQLVHEKSRMKQCSECGFIATCSGSLNKHNKAVHLKLKNHVCDKCKKEFVTNQQLLRHLRHHSKERPFKCLNDFCDKYFADSHGRKRHLNICSFSK
ncbi:hypothetical protein PVAND_009698 [Polypedilum vanderplanki]|uniref:Zinc finger protein n=1 Tax=Polypedilum vanderplanki TaxID=319348 RepID=A0A9J6CE17_POLVA|nr:hypothetical protein PVAND_009698 [Polypedilum vanderplanki]